MLYGISTVFDRKDSAVLIEKNSAILFKKKYWKINILIKLKIKLFLAIIS